MKSFVIRLHGQTYFKIGPPRKNTPKNVNSCDRRHQTSVWTSIFGGKNLHAQCTHTRTHFPRRGWGYMRYVVRRRVFSLLATKNLYILKLLTLSVHIHTADSTHSRPDSTRNYVESISIHAIHMALLLLVVVSVVLFFSSLDPKINSHHRIVSACFSTRGGIVALCVCVSNSFHILTLSLLLRVCTPYAIHHSPDIPSAAYHIISSYSYTYCVYILHEWIFVVHTHRQRANTFEPSPNSIFIHLTPPPSLSSSFISFSCFRGANTHSWRQTRLPTSIFPRQFLASFCVCRVTLSPLQSHLCNTNTDYIVRLPIWF